MSTTKRTVREDQHGTMTGYVYGCRCDRCKEAQRNYVPAAGIRDDQHGTTTGYRYGCRCGECKAAERDRVATVSAESKRAVLVALERDADLDGLATSGGNRLAELTGLSATYCLDAIHALEADGLVSIVGAEGRGGTLAVTILDGAA